MAGGPLAAGVAVVFLYADQLIGVCRASNQSVFNGETEGLEVRDAVFAGDVIILQKAADGEGVVGAGTIGENRGHLADVELSSDLAFDEAAVLRHRSEEVEVRHCDVDAEQADP